MLKRTLFFTVLLFIFALPSIAQEHYIGVLGRYNISGITSEPPLKYLEDMSSFKNFGIIYKYYNKKVAGIQAEINFTERGYIKNDTTFRLPALEIPVMSQIYFKFGPVRLFVNGGLFGSYYFNSATFQPKDGEKEDYHFTDRDNRFDYGIQGGGGVGISFAKRFEIQGECRYQYSLSYLFEPIYSGQATAFSHSYQTVFSVSLLYRFGKLNLKKPND